MTPEKFEKWVEKNGVQTISKHINRLEYKYAFMPDGWVSVFKVEDGAYIPMIQAISEKKADEYCGLIEPVTVPVTFL